MTAQLGQTASLTDTGRKRRHNEDAYVVEPPLFAVADGMGGAQAGELASGLAAAALRDERSELTLSAVVGRAAHAAHCAGEPHRATALGRRALELADRTGHAVSSAVARERLGISARSVQSAAWVVARRTGLILAPQGAIVRRIH